MDMVPDDIGDVWVNGTYIRTLNTNWELKSYPTESAFSLSLLTGTNVISIHVKNNNDEAGVVASITSSDGRTVLARTSRAWNLRVIPL